MDPKKQLLKLLSSIGDGKLDRIKRMIQIGCTKHQLATAFRITTDDAELLIANYRSTGYIPSPVCMGSKTEQYYKEEFQTMPTYLLGELEAEEKMISLKDTSCKLWTWID